MSGAAPGPATSTAPTGRALWRSSRGPLAALLVLTGVSVALAALRATGDDGLLDPGSYAPQGSRAVAALLEDRGVPVRTVGSIPAVRAAPAGPLLVPRPQELTEAELTELAALGRAIVVVGAGPATLQALGVPVDVEPADVATRQPACDLPAARTAGPARAGGLSYAVTDGSAGTGCYAAGGRATLLALPGPGVTLLGAAEPLTNDALAEEGNAALAVGLLSGVPGDTVLWLLPDAGRAVPGGPVSVRSLLPDAVLIGALQVAVAVVLLALWRARRLGRVVVEPLPVVVRAAETVEGRGRLYQAAGARDAAAAALRAGARDRLARRLNLPPEPDRGTLVALLAHRGGHDPAALDALLYGAPPVDDGALVRLADALDAVSPGPRGSAAPRPPAPDQPRTHPEVARP